MKKITRSIQQLIQISRNNHDHGDHDAASVVVQQDQDSKNDEALVVVLQDPKSRLLLRRQRRTRASQEEDKKADNWSCSGGSTICSLDLSSSSLRTLDLSGSSCGEDHRALSSHSSYPTQVVYQHEKNTPSSRPRRHLRQRQRYSVRFDEGHNHIHEAGAAGAGTASVDKEEEDDDDGGDDDEQDRCGWYTEEECRRMKEENQFTFQTVCRMVRSGGGGGTNDDKDTSYAGVLARVYRACCNDEDAQPLFVAADSESSPLFKELCQQCQLWIPRIGLEHKLLSVILSNNNNDNRNNTHYQTPHCRQMALIRRFAVARQQQQQQQQQIRQEESPMRGLSGQGESDATMTAETLRQECEQLSRPSRLFAHVLAQAQQPLL
ncbi:hypothetical protein ACA910_003947 [Epithemia clementina (nom. ined.)]